MTTSIYILSQGQKEDQDYAWFKIKKENLIRETPAIFKRVPVETVIDHQKPSIILARQDSELVLLITGLKAREERIDFMGRSVRNSIAWVYSDSEEHEKILRSLAILELKNELKSELDRAITIGGEYGLKVDKNAIEQLGFPETLASQPAETICKLGKNCPKLRQDLADELQNYSIPSKDGFLMILTTLKAKSALSLSGVWRGLSDRIENEEWEIIPHSNQFLPSPTYRPVLSSENKNNHSSRINNSDHYSDDTDLSGDLKLEKLQENILNNLQGLQQENRFYLLNNQAEIESLNPEEKEVVDKLKKVLKELQDSVDRIQTYFQDWQDFDEL